jgi:hypothetical protein
MFCKHSHLRFVRQTSGDENNYALSQGGRYVHECLDCGRSVYRNENMGIKKIFSWDAETDGLWGQAFAIGAMVLDESAAEIARFVGRLPDMVVTNDWVKANVLPTMTGVAVTHETYDDLLRAFAKFYLANKQDAEIVVHMGYIVEAKVLRDMYERGYIEYWDGPYPLYDVSGNLQAAGADPTSVDQFAAEHGLEVGEFEGGTHNPLYDSAVAAAVYRYLTW